MDEKDRIIKDLRRKLVQMRGFVITFTITMGFSAMLIQLWCNQKQNGRLWWVIIPSKVPGIMVIPKSMKSCLFASYRRMASRVPICVIGRGFSISADSSVSRVTLHSFAESMAFVIGRRMASRVPIRVIGRGFSKSADSAFFEAWKLTNTKKTAEELEDFLIMTRRGSKVSNDEILSFAKLFNDELTLDNISRPRLFNLCKYMGISPFGTDDAYLRYMLLKHLERIKADDKLIQEQGVDSLSEAELRENCRERGMLGLLSVEEMHQQLRDWLYLSLNLSVPASLLILSRPFTVSGKLKPEVVQAAISSLPDEVKVKDSCALLNCRVFMRLSFSIVGSAKK